MHTLRRESAARGRPEVSGFEIGCSHPRMGAGDQEKKWRRMSPTHWPDLAGFIETVRVAATEGPTWAKLHDGDLFLRNPDAGWSVLSDVRVNSVVLSNRHIAWRACGAVVRSVAFKCPVTSCGIEPRLTVADFLRLLDALAANGLTRLDIAHMGGRRATLGG